MSEWTREQIIRELIRREAAALPLYAGRKSDVEPALHESAIRVFGSWRNAVTAAGIPVELAVSHDRWPPAKVLAAIQTIARRKTPLRPNELRERYGKLSSAARRIFGSWSRAVIAAGVDPAKLRTNPAWTQDRVVEEILIRALKREPLRARSVEPKSLNYAGVRLFGNWSAALDAAGVDLNNYDVLPAAARSPTQIVTDDPMECVDTTAFPLNPTPLNSVPRRRGHPWTNELITQSILARLRKGSRINAKAVYREDRALLRAATRRHGNWRNALIACGLNPSEHEHSTYLKDTTEGFEMTGPGDQRTSAIGSTISKKK
jgi:hypothetical protein